jgi:hypothetical protein
MLMMCTGKCLQLHTMSKWKCHVTTVDMNSSIISVTAQVKLLHTI